MAQLEEALEYNIKRLDKIIFLMKKKEPLAYSSTKDDDETSKKKRQSRNKNKITCAALPSPSYLTDSSSCSKSPERRKKDPAKK